VIAKIVSQIESEDKKIGKNIKRFPKEHLTRTLYPTKISTSLFTNIYEYS